jgi:putative chitobiose transport system permease protein
MSVQVGTHSQEQNQRSKIPKRRVNLSPYLLIAPAMIFMLVFVFYPIVAVFSLSTTNYNLAFQRDNIGLSNYERILTLDWRVQQPEQTVRQTIPRGYGVLFTVDVLGSRYILSARDPDFWQAMMHSVVYLLATPILIVLSIGLAVTVNQPLRGIGFFRAGFYLPAITSVVALGLMWRTLYQQNGLLNQILLLLGLDPIGWLTQPPMPLVSSILVTVWRGVGFYMVIFLAGLQSIPRELYEAAAIDGANRWTQHMNITLPGLRPSIIFVAVISSISALRAFEEVYVIAGEDGGVLNSARTAIMYIYNQFDTRQIGYAAAISVVFFLATLVFSILNVRLLERRES